MRLATDLHGGLVQRQPPPRRFHIYRFRLGSSPHTPAPEPTTELCIPAPVHRSHPLSFIGPETGKSQLSRPAAYAQRTGKTTFADLRSVRLRGKRSRLWCRRQDSNLRLSELALYATIRPSSTAEVRLHEGGAGLSRLSPLRVGCLRLAPIGTRFCFLLVLYPRKPVPVCTSLEHWIWCRRLDSNQRHTSWRGALPTELRLRMGAAPYPALAARRKPRSLMALGDAI